MFFNHLSPDTTSEQSIAHVGCWAKVKTWKRRVKVEGRKGKDKERENKRGGLEVEEGTERWKKNQRSREKNWIGRKQERSI